MCDKLEINKDQGQRMFNSLNPEADHNKMYPWRRGMPENSSACCLLSVKYIFIFWYVVFANLTGLNSQFNPKHPWPESFPCVNAIITFYYIVCIVGAVCTPMMYSVCTARASRGDQEMTSLSLSPANEPWVILKQGCSLTSVTCSLSRPLAWPVPRRYTSKSRLWSLSKLSLIINKKTASSYKPPETSNLCFFI